MAEPDKQDALSRAWRTLDGVVWALLAQGVPYVDIDKRVAHVRSEWLPSDQPAFVSSPGQTAPE